MHGRRYAGEDHETAAQILDRESLALEDEFPGPDGLPTDGRRTGHDNRIEGK